jgi:hypothetical protein
VVVVGNLCWPAASVVAAAAGWRSPTATGIAVVLAQAAAVVVFGELQLTGLRRSARGGLRSGRRPGPIPHRGGSTRARRGGLARAAGVEAVEMQATKGSARERLREQRKRASQADGERTPPPPS